MPLRFLTSGESHGPSLVAILEGLPAGITVSIDAINHDLMRRQRGFGAGPRMKLEHDTIHLLSGVMVEGGIPKTTGSPVAMLIENKDHTKWRGKPIKPFTAPRPGHADLTGKLKYGYSDLRPALERASARETAVRVAVGSMCRQFLGQFGIQVGGYVSSIGNIVANLDDIPLEERPARAVDDNLSCPDPRASEAMQSLIRKTIEEKDTLGGIIEVVAMGLPPGLGSYVQWDRRLDARLAAAVLSIQAMKGMEIGPAFENAHLLGTQTQDPILLEGENLIRPSNRSGGLEGGITTGQPLHIRVAMKPIATTLKPQHTVDLYTGKVKSTDYERSDFCPVPRAVVIVEAMVAFVLADALLEKLGGDSMDEIRPRFEALRKATLSDLHLDGQEHIFWPEDY